MNRVTVPWSRTGHGARGVSSLAGASPCPERRQFLERSLLSEPNAATSGPGRMTRRRYVQLTTLATMGGAFPPWQVWAGPARNREYHLCLNPRTVLDDQDLIALLKRSGISCVWLAGFFYGHWPWPVDTLIRARESLRRAGLDARIVNVPLGHPGDSLGSRDKDFPLTPPTHWRIAHGADGSTYAGTSLHSPATQENKAALRNLRRAGFSSFFLDDDFRLARGPGVIGGCFCDEHRARFLRRAGLSDSHWLELLDDVRSRRLTRLLREWTEFACDDLTASFRAQRSEVTGDLGIMVMYMGAEKAGIRLKDYRRAPLRVGELMFDDRSFDPVKGKTDELFSALFHRRFVEPESAWSESTAYPADELSARNLAAKLVISTLADIRHTMFMSGVTSFPATHWPTLAPEMKRQAGFHSRLAGHKPRGPFKHYWGEASRLVGDDRPFSLFLAAGVPFEVTHSPAKDGWTFLSDADVAAVAEGRLASPGTRFLSRPSDRGDAGAISFREETLDAVFAFKQSIRPVLRGVPVVENDQPAVLAWYPGAHSALLWNLRPERTTFLVSFGKQNREVNLGSLESALLPDLHPRS